MSKPTNVTISRLDPTHISIEFDVAGKRHRVNFWNGDPSDPKDGSFWYEGAYRQDGNAWTDLDPGLLEQGDVASLVQQGWGLLPPFREWPSLHDTADPNPGKIKQRLMR